MGMKFRQEHEQAVIGVFDDLIDWGGASTSQLRAFYDEYALGFERFRLFGDPQIKTSIQNDTNHSDWLTTPVKNQIVARLDEA